MVFYHFFIRNGYDEPSLVGILPERRKNPLRITRQSIMKWGQLAAGSYVDPATLYFIRVEIREEEQVDTWEMYSHLPRPVYEYDAVP